MLSIGIVGLPNVGKSSLFNAITKSSVLVANYPFATIEPNTGIVPVPDERLTKLAQIYNSKNIIPASIKFIDIAGLVAGASKGEGLGNLFLSHIRTTSVIVEVVRAFNDTLVTHVNQNSNPGEDIAIINTELILADLATVNKRLPQLEKEAKANPKLKSTLEQLQSIHQLLDSGKLLYNNLTKDQLNNISDLQLITAKPIIYVFNIDEDKITDINQQKSLQKLVDPSPSVFLCAKLESELASLSEADANELRESYSVHQSGLKTLITTAYNTLGLVSYLTAGEKEVKAWTIPINATAPEAAGVIHSDFQRGFIAAEVVNYSDLIELGSIHACRANGKLRTEGKDYVMQPNDVVEFRFNV